MGKGKQRWKITFHWPQSHNDLKNPSFPKEFTCPISNGLMADPVIISSGQTFERNCIDVCKKLNFTPILPDGSALNFSTIIPNLALKAAISNWCKANLVEFPKPVGPISAEKLVRAMMGSHKQEKSFSESGTPRHHVLADIASAPTTPLATRPSCLSSTSSSDTEPQIPNSIEFDDDIVSRLRCSNSISEQVEVLGSLRKITRTEEKSRVKLCTPELLSALRSLITSRYANIQVNAVASVVNLSLEDQNKVKIVRSGIVPPLINALKGGSPEAQDHAIGAIFSLALDKQNKTALGVLGALPPLLHSLRTGSNRSRNDSALALYHLSLVQSNREKLVRLGSAQVLVGMVRSGHMVGRVMLVLCNLALCGEGRGAMLDGGAVECIVGTLNTYECENNNTKSIRESCVVALYRLSHGGLRFRGLAKEAKVEEAMMKVEKTGSERGKEKARKILEVIRGKDEEDEEEEVDWEELLNSGEVTKSF